MNRPGWVTVLVILDLLVGVFLLFLLIPWVWRDLIYHNMAPVDLIALVVFSVLCGLSLYLAVGLWRMSPRARRVGIMSSRTIGGLFLLGTLGCTIWFFATYNDNNSWTPVLAMVLGFYQALIASVFGVHLLILTRPHVKEAFVGIDQPKPAS